MDVRMPDGTIVTNVPDDITQTDLLARYNSYNKPTPAPTPQVDPNSSDFMRGVKSYLPQTKEILGGTEALVGKALGSEDITQAGIRRVQEANKAQQAISRDTDEFTSAWNKGIGAVITDWLPYQIGQGVSNITETLATAGAGAVLGSVVGPEGTAGGAITGFVGKQLVKKGIKDATEKIIQEQGKEAAEKYVAKQTADYLASKEGRKEVNKYIGSTVGMAAQAGVHGTGETTSRAIGEAEAQGKRPEDIDLSKVLPASAVHTVADFVVQKIGLNALGTADKAAGRSLVADVTKRVAVTGAKEVPAEEIQSIAERYGANLSLTDAEALKEYVNTAAASFAMAVAPGTVGGVRSHLAAKPVDAVTDELDQKETQKADQNVDQTVSEETPIIDAEIEDVLNNTVGKKDGKRAKYGADRTSAELSGESLTEQPAERIRKSDRNRVVGDGSLARDTEERTDAESTTLKNNEVVKEITETPADVVTDKVVEQQPKTVYREESKETPGAETIKFEKKVAKPIKAIGPVTKEPSAQNYLNKNAFYGESAPQTKENAVTYAARDHAYDMFDTIDYENGVVPAIQSKMDEHNAKQEERRTALRAELEEKGISPKEIESTLNSKLPVYEAIKDAPKFMSMDDLVSLYKEHAGKREYEEGGKARKDHTADRESFIGSLTPEEQTAVMQNSERAFEQEVLTDITNRETTATDKRKASERAKAVKEVKDTSVEDEYDAIVRELNSLTEDKSQQNLDAQITEQERALEDHNRVYETLSTELKAKRPPKEKKSLKAELATVTAERDTTSKKLAELRSQRRRSSTETKANALRERLAELEGQLDEEARADRAALKETPPAKSLTGEKTTAGQILNKTQSKLKEALQSAIKGKQTLSEILSTVANERLNYFSSQQVAKSILSIAKKNKLDLKAKIVFGELPAGKDGKFDPATNTITLKGEDGVYTGKRKIERVIMHEVMHYLTDHVTGNQKAYILSLPAEQRASATAALKRLDNNFRLAKAKLGRKYHISSMKEFIAEAYSNPSFQKELAEIEQRGVSRSITNVFYEFVKNIVAALGIDRAEYGAPLQEVLEDVASIISIPSDKLKSKEVSYATATPKKAEVKTRKVKLDESNPDYDLERNDNPKTQHYIRTMFSSVAGWQNVARIFQNDRYPVKSLQDQMQLAGKLISEGKDKMNNVYTQIVLATSNAKNYFKRYVAEESDKLNTSVGEFAEAMGLDTKGALEYLHKVLEAVHEPERRMTKYVLNVPLSTVVQKGEKRSAAEQRTKIIDLLKNKTLTKAQAKQLRTELDRLVFEKDAKGNLKYVEPQGQSPIPGNKITDINSEVYSATGMDQASIKEITAAYNNHEHKDKIDAVISHIQKLNLATIELNKIGNYYSAPVNNFVNFYGWKNYIPLKGIIKHSEADEMLDYNGKRLGSELQEATYAWEGRTTASDNPVIQVMSDATRAAMRAGRRDLTQSIKNVLEKNKLNPSGQGIIKGFVKEHVAFENREELSEKYKGQNTIFHYNEDGSVDVLVINDRRMLEAIRRTYKTTNPVIDVANRLTSFLGTVHTRYNYNFAPLNFVRDALTNAWTIGAEMGPLESAKFLKTLSAQLVHGGLPKAMKVSYAYSRNDFNKLKQLAKSDPYMKDMVEYIEKGGLVSYLQGISNKSNFEEMNRQIGKAKVGKGWEAVNKNLDTWIEMFEISSRSAAYGIKKRNLISQGMTESAAATEAAAFAKNLANFEQVGELGKVMGAFYMFFRPSATGAVRAIESIAPAWMNVDQAVLRLPSHIREDAQAVATFKKNFGKQQQHARVMSAALIGAGALMYLMSAMSSDDDELGRNSTLNDNMSQWTRFARFHMKNAKGDDVVVQAPWGFGLGALAATGAQLAAVSLGRQSAKDALGNMFQISLDSFIPVPVSRMSPTDAPLNFAIDSIMPSFARPIVEFALNKNGLGQDIYNDANRRMGDAYTGGDKIPQIYKDAAAYFADETNGGIDISPNTLYFLSNSYADGFARVFEEAQGVYDLAKGEKSFSAKTDLPLIGSFFGAKANVDSMEFTKVENVIKDKERRLKMFETNPEQYAKYVSENPADEYIVEAYNNAINGHLKELRTQANEIRATQGLSQKDRQEILKIITLEQNIVKRNLIDNFKAMGVEP